MSSDQIGDIRFFVFTDCSFNDEHHALFLQLSGVPITQAQLRFNENGRTCEWPILLDPTTFVGPIDSISEHVWHVTNMLHEKAGVLNSLHEMNCRFWLRVYCQKNDQTVSIDPSIMKRLVEWSIIIQLIPGDASEPSDAPKERVSRFDDGNSTAGPR